MWECKKCRESVEDSFEVCWNCGTSKAGVEDPSFRSEVDARVVAEAAEGGDHVIARGLVEVFRLLAVIGGLWGLVNIGLAVEASLAAQSARAIAVFAAVIAAVATAVALVAFPLGMAEILRFCLLVEANTRVASQSPAREKEERGRK